MKIVITSSYKIGGETGAVVIAEELARNLSKGNNVLFVCLGDDYEKKKISKGLEVLLLPSMLVKYGDAPSISPAINSKLKKDLKAFSPDIIHAQNILLVDLLTITWGLNNRVPVLVTFHQVPTDAVYHILPKLAGKKIGKAINYPYSKIHTKRLLENINGVIALNFAVESSVRKISKEARVYRVNNGLELSKLLKLKSKKQVKEKKFVFLGSYFPRKNQEYLIKAFRYLPKHFKLELYGNKSTGGPYLEKLESMVEKYELRNTAIKGFVPRREIYKIYRSADYLISASVKEAQSLVIIEALASATPVVGLSNETMDELINSSNGLVLGKKTGSKAFAKRVKDFIISSKYQDLATQARADATPFEISNVVDRLENVYEKTIIEGPKIRVKTNKLLYYLLPKSVYRNVVTNGKSKYVNIAAGITVAFTSVVSVVAIAKRISRKK